MTDATLARVCLLALAAALDASAQEAPAAVAGRVKTRTGDPAAHALLLLRWRAHPELPGLTGFALADQGLAEQRASAGADGRFKIALPHRGPFELTARAADGDDVSAPQFPVLAGDFVDLLLQVPTSVGGTVLDADGNALAGIAVTLVPQSTTWTRLASYRLPEPRGSTRTDAAGRFRLPFPNGYLQSPRWEAFVVARFDAPGLLPQPADQLLRPTAFCADFTVTLAPAAAQTGCITDAAGKPLAGASVWCTTEPWQRATTAADGGYTLTARRPTFVATCPGHGPIAFTWGRPANAAADAVPTTALPAAAPVRARLRDGKGAPLAAAPVLWSMPMPHGVPLESLATTTDDGSVVCAQAAAGMTVLGFVAVDGAWLPFCRVACGKDATDLGAIAPRGREVRGQVLDLDGTPLAHARVALLADAALADEPASITYTDRGGRFRCASVPPGRVRLRAEAGAQGFAGAELPGEADTAVLRVTATGAVTGTVVDDQGAPVAGAWLTLIRAGGIDDGLMPGINARSTTTCTRTDEQGRFHFGGLPDGDWTVMSNFLRDGEMFGGSSKATSGGVEVVVATRRLRG